MPVRSSNGDSAYRETAFRRLLEASQCDTEGQRELIGTHARDETDAVYWEDNQLE